MLVGEIRDRETAMIAIEAALTGHLVLATLHTNDAASTPMRLVEMGIEPFLVTSALTGGPGPAAGPPAVRALPGAVRAHRGRHRGGGLDARRGRTPTPTKPTLYRAVGCSACSNTGYRGRKALLELLVVTEDDRATDHRRRNG